MANGGSDKIFAGSIPTFYDEYLVPLIFRPYAEDLTRRLAARSVSRVLEIAAGTGVVTRSLAEQLPAHVSIIATDLNRPMIEMAARIGTSRAVDWRVADAMELPFDDALFDAVVCQFGVMFFPDKAQAFAEARRVLQPGGVLLFNTWDRIEDNEFADTVTHSLETLFADDPPRFLARTPHGYHDIARIEQDLRDGGFDRPPRIDTVTLRSHAATARIPALAYCQGTPLRNEIEAREPASLEQATDIATAAIADKFGPGPVDGKIQAHVVAVA